MPTNAFFRLGQLVAPLSLTATLGLGFSTKASAFTLGSASDFNLFVFGDVTQSNTDVEGRIAVGGNASLINYGVGDKLTNSYGTRNDLIVGGDLTYNSGQVFNGNAVYGGNQNISQVGFPHGSYFQAAPINFATVKQELLNLSAELGNLATTSNTVFNYGQILLNGTGTGLNVFNVSGSQLSSANTFTINADENASVVVNITGQEINFGNFGFFLNGVNQENVVYNFVDATKLSSQSVTILGSVLAPKAAYNFNNGNLEGTLIANSLTGNGEFHNSLYKGGNDDPEEPPKLPEPATILGLGLVAGALGISRWKSKQAIED